MAATGFFPQQRDPRIIQLGRSIFTPIPLDQVYEFNPLTFKATQEMTGPNAVLMNAQSNNANSYRSPLLDFPQISSFPRSVPPTLSVIDNPMAGVGVLSTNSAAESTPVKTEKIERAENQEDSEKFKQQENEDKDESAIFCESAIAHEERNLMTTSTPRKLKKRSKRVPLSSSDEEYNVDNDSDEVEFHPRKRSATTRNSKKKSKLDRLQGEHRLIIQFENLGTLGRNVQNFGNNNCYVPDGLIGTHTVYNQPWKFEIHHGPTEEGVTCIIWKITNLQTGEIHEATETPDEARRRERQGWTISNRLFRDAMKSRVDSLLESLDTETDSTKVANIHSLIKHLQPKRFNEGTLVFGLQHRQIQDRMNKLLLQRTETNSRDEFSKNIKPDSNEI